MKNAIGLSLQPTSTKTRIMATVGRKSIEYEELKAMVEEGATFFRFNGAHIIDGPAAGDSLTYDEAIEVARNVRRLRSEFRRLIGIYFDLGGPKIRVLHVLGVQANDNEGNPKEVCNKPKLGERVIVRVRDAQIIERYNKALKDFESGGAKLEWKNKGSVLAFFEGARCQKKNPTRYAR